MYVKQMRVQLQAVLQAKYRILLIMQNVLIKRLVLALKNQILIQILVQLVLQVRNKRLQTHFLVFHKQVVQIKTVSMYVKQMRVQLQAVLQAKYRILLIMQNVLIKRLVLALKNQILIQILVQLVLQVRNKRLQTHFLVFHKQVVQIKTVSMYVQQMLVQLLAVPRVKYRILLIMQNVLTKRHVNAQKNQILIQILVQLVLQVRFKILLTHFLALQEHIVQIKIVSMIVQQTLVQLRAVLQEKYRILLIMQNVLIKRLVLALKNYLLVQILVQLVLQVRNKILQSHFLVFHKQVVQIKTASMCVQQMLVQLRAVLRAKYRILLIMQNVLTKRHVNAQKNQILIQILVQLVLQVRFKIRLTHFLVLQEQVVLIEIVSMIVQQMLVQLQAALQAKYRILLMMQNALIKRHVRAHKNQLLNQILVQLVLQVRFKIRLTHFLVLQEQVVLIEIVSMIVQQMLVQLQAALQAKYRILLMMQNALIKRHVRAHKNQLLNQILVQLVLQVRFKIRLTHFLVLQEQVVLIEIVSMIVQQMLVQLQAALQAKYRILLMMKLVLLKLSVKLFHQHTLRQTILVLAKRDMQHYN